MNLNMVPFGNYGAQPSTVNILVAITNTGNLAVSYSYQGPEYQNLRTGVRLHDGSIVSLEAWGATQISAAEPLPTLQAEPLPEPTPTPTQEPATPEEIQAEVVEAAQLASEISDLNNLIAAINNEEPAEEVEPEPSPEPSTDVTEEPDLPEPDVEVEPEIITPEDPRFPDDEEQTEPEDPNPSPSPDTTDGENEETDPTPEPSEEPSPQPEDTDPSLEPEPEQPVDEDPVVTPDKDNTDSNPISDEELKKLNKLISVNDAKLMSAVSTLLTELNPEQSKELAKDLGIKTEEVLLIAEIAKENPAVAAAVVQFADKAAENENAPMPYTLADAVTEIQTEAFLADPLGVLTDIDFEKLLSPTEWGKDMTDDQREKVQEVVIPVILVGNIVSSVMSLRRL
jgi:hypothetical protein